MTLSGEIAYLEELALRNPEAELLLRKLETIFFLQTQNNTLGVKFNYALNTCIKCGKPTVGLLCKEDEKKQTVHQKILKYEFLVNDVIKTKGKADKYIIFPTFVKFASKLGATIWRGEDGGYYTNSNDTIRVRLSIKE